MPKRFEFRVTVGAVIEQDRKILLVQELQSKKQPQGPVVFSQPTGHLEEGETLIEGVIREVKEETGYTIQPTGLIGVYLNRYEDASVMRFSFIAEITNEPRVAITDPDVLEASWFPLEEIRAGQINFRQGSTVETFKNYFAGKKYPLELVHFFDKRKA